MFQPPHSRPVRVIGACSYLPPHVAAAADIDARTGAEPGWTAARTGVLERREARGETAASIGAKAATGVLDRAGRASSNASSAPGDALTVTGGLDDPPRPTVAP